MKYFHFQTRHGKLTLISPVSLFLTAALVASVRTRWIHAKRVWKKVVITSAAALRLGREPDEKWIGFQKLAAKPTEDEGRKKERRNSCKKMKETEFIWQISAKDLI